MPNLVTETRDGFFYAALLEGKTLTDLAVDTLGQTCFYQSIWRVKIDRIVPGLGAFAAIGDRSILLRDTQHKSGDIIIVQIKSLRREDKADIATQDIALGGTYFVYLPKGEKIRASRKIDPVRATALIAALNDQGIASGIVRTGAVDAPQEKLLAEAAALHAEWQNLAAPGPMGLLKNGPDAARRLAHDYPQLGLIATEDDFAARGIAEQIAAALQPRLSLPSGGSIVIEPTAALTAIDVNAGTAAPATADREAAPLIATQIRIRNLSGLIAIDFTGKDRPEALLELVRRALGTDPAGARIAGISPSGLVEIIRPARDLPLREKLS